MVFMADFFSFVIKIEEGVNVGGVDAARHTAWREVPPNWLTARDHLLAIFRKP